MDDEIAAALTDGLLAAASVSFAAVLARTPARRGWAALFALMAVSATLGGLYHGFDALRVERLWTVLSGLTLATGPVFFRVCVAAVDRSWAKRSRVWRWWTMAAFAGGAALADFPFAWVAAGAGACVLLAAARIARTDRRAYRDRVYAGIVVTIGGLLVQAALAGNGLLSGNAVFHEIQIAANAMFFAAARTLPPD